MTRTKSALVTLFVAVSPSHDVFVPRDPSAPPHTSWRPEQAHGHHGHDTIMYVSAAGGCCDCGDAASWRPEGACAHHSPLDAVSSGESPRQQQQRREGVQLTDGQAFALTAALGIVSAALCCEVGRAAPPACTQFAFACPLRGFQPADVAS